MKKASVVVTGLLCLVAQGARAENFEQQVQQVNQKASGAVLNVRQVSQQAVAVYTQSDLALAVGLLPNNDANFEKIERALAELGVVQPDATFEGAVLKLMAQVDLAQRPQELAKVTTAFDKAGLPKTSWFYESTKTKILEIEALRHAIDEMRSDAANKQANLLKVNAALGALGLRPAADIESGASTLRGRVDRLETLADVLAVKDAFVKGDIKVPASALTPDELWVEKSRMISSLGRLLSDHDQQKENYGKLAQALTSLNVKPASSFMAALAQLQHRVQDASTRAEIEGLIDALCLAGL